MIGLSGITRTFDVGGRPVHALRGIDLDVPSGGYLSIMGPSGSGKSTLLNVLGCLDRPTSGRYVLDGEEVSGLDDAALSLVRRHKIGFVFQFFHLVGRLNAIENVEMPMMFAGIPRKERLARARRALTSVGLEERMDHRPDQLSGGESQRVAIARSIVMNPAILLADEPTGNLDSVSGREVIELLERMNRDGLTLIVVTHDPAMGRRARQHLQLFDGTAVPPEQPDTPEGANGTDASRDGAGAP